MRYREDTGYPVLGATPPVRSRAYALVKIVPPAQFCLRDSLTLIAWHTRLRFPLFPQNR